VLLISSRGQNGRRITARWNRTAINSQIFRIQNVFVDKKLFASGGIFPPNNNTTTPNDSQQQVVVVQDEETKTIMVAILDRLNNPVAPVVNKVITLKQIKDARAQKLRIEADEAFR
jgi:hypothetical protein